MTIEHLPTWLLETGDVIRARHEHDSRCGDCLARWETDAVVTARPAAVCGRVVVSWAAVSPGARRARPCHRRQRVRPGRAGPAGVQGMARGFSRIAGAGS